MRIVKKKNIYIYIYKGTYIHSYIYIYVCVCVCVCITYIQCGHIWHRNKLSRCQTELLVSCSNDEHQTSLKWDSSSHPVAPECRVSHTLRLKHFRKNVLRSFYGCCITITTATAVQASYIAKYVLSTIFLQPVISWTTFESSDFQIV